jgi:multiple sugar transport system ATP-binding protein
MAAIEFDSVSKVYGGAVRAVDNLTLEVEDGEFVVLLGPSGCGKTTALRMVAGLESVTGGTVRIGGKAVNNVVPRDRDVAMVFQNYALYPHMSVRDNIGFGLRMRGLPKRDRVPRVERTARSLALSDYLERKPNQLSGGQRQRVAMGRAIVREPRVFLMDEPLSNLDARLRVQMRTEIVRIQHDLRVTTLYVTHDQVEAMTMADRVAVMRAGVLQQFDTPDEVYAHPANLFVASFIGSPAMNLVEAVIEQAGDVLVCRVGDQTLSLSDTAPALRSSLQGRVGSAVAVGIRPEALSQATTDAPVTLSGTVLVAESLGFETLAHVRVDAPPVSHPEIFDTAPELDSSGLASTEEGADAVPSGAGFVARLPAGTSLRDGEPVVLAVDVTRLHFFDLQSGAAIV